VGGGIWLLTCCTLIGQSQATLTGPNLPITQTALIPFQTFFFPFSYSSFFLPSSSSSFPFLSVAEDDAPATW
jgi:hypothetical protein